MPLCLTITDQRPDRSIPLVATGDQEIIRIVAEALAARLNPDGPCNSGPRLVSVGRSEVSDEE